MLVKHDPENGTWGDCFRTCIACLLDVDPATVPHAYADGNLTEGHALRIMREWLKERGLGILSITFWADHKFGPDDLTWDTHYILSGESPNFPDVGHATIGKGPLFEVVHDVAHSGKGLAQGYLDASSGKRYYVCEFLVRL
jgi:hypothetical protein